MWIRNIKTDVLFDIDDESLIKDLLSKPLEYEEVKEGGKKKKEVD